MSGNCPDYGMFFFFFFLTARQGGGPFDSLYLEHSLPMKSDTELHAPISRRQFLSAISLRRTSKDLNSCPLPPSSLRQKYLKILTKTPIPC